MNDSVSARRGDEDRPVRDADATTQADPDSDPAQREWDEAGAAGERGAATATGRDPDEIPDPEDEIPAEDLPAPEAQPETQGADPEVADLGEDGQGDLSAGDL